jgi:hypothetical protein
MTSRDTEPHVKPPPEAIATSGFAVVSARLPDRSLGWVAVWRRSCGCVSHVGPHLDAINAIIFRGGVGEVYIETIQPIDPT